MKQFLLILGILAGVLLFASNESVGSKGELGAVLHETIMKEKNEATDIQHKIEAISNELKGSSCLTPRRVVQASNPIINLRLSNNGEKTLQLFRLKQEGAFYRISNNLSIHQTIHISSLLCRMGHHVFALRKLII